MSVHETVVLWFLVGCSARGDRITNHFIDLSPALGRQTYKHFCVLLCIANFFGSKSLELGFSQQHDEYVIAHDHAGGRLVGKLRIELEAEFCKELYGLIEILDWQIHKDFGGHVVSFRNFVARQRSREKILDSILALHSPK